MERSRARPCCTQSRSRRPKVSISAGGATVPGAAGGGGPTKCPNQTGTCSRRFVPSSRPRRSAGPPGRPNPNRRGRSTDFEADGFWPRAHDRTPGRVNTPGRERKSRRGHSTQSFETERGGHSATDRETRLEEDLPHGDGRAHGRGMDISRA